MKRLGQVAVRLWSGASVAMRRIRTNDGELLQRLFSTKRIRRSSVAAQV
jgi:hypothetical protein